MMHSNPTLNPQSTSKR